MNFTENSLEARELKEYIKADKSPMDSESVYITLFKGTVCSKDEKYVINLDGMWSLGDIDAEVPGSIHTALYKAGVIEDPYYGHNDDIAKAQSEKDWYYTKNFEYKGCGRNVKLIFDGIADRCDIYLNNSFISFHQGMFAPIVLDVSKYIVQGKNTVKVHIYPAIEWSNTVVFNCSYGWHYGRIWPLGIWRSVRVIDMPDINMESPFITTLSHETGTVDLSVDITGKNINGTLKGFIKPFNFDGESYTFNFEISKDKKGIYTENNKTTVRLTFDIPEFKLWWPNGYGKQNLYTLNLEYSVNDVCICTSGVKFGIRTLKMLPYPKGAKEDEYSRTCCINGKGLFMKGAGWCTIDALMRFDRECYDRILKRAKQQGVNLFRAWGGGLVETEEFYDLCDEYGLCVYQEWPCCWDSQKMQPKELLYETVVSETKRIRSHPSLILYGGGNEGNGAFEDEVLSRIGALTYEYDGTRVYYRQDGGISGKGMTHDHIHWGGEKPEHYLTRYAHTRELNMHEYGLDSFMNYESVLKYASLGDIIEWPIISDSVIAHHTATFNGVYGWGPTPHGHDIATFMHYAGMFLEPSSVKDLITGSQLAQATAVYPTVINSRIKWPYCTNVVYYKFNDVYPGASWSVVDWYGSPKIAHYLCQDAFMNLMACGLFDRYNTTDKHDKDLKVPVYILDDNNETDGKKYTVYVKAYDNDLKCIKSSEFEGLGPVSNSFFLGDFCLNEHEASYVPLHITFTLFLNGEFVSRTFMFLNFDNEQGSLFNLPKTTLEWVSDDNTVTVTNTGNVPAVFVHVLCEDSCSFECSDSYFFLDVGESRNITVSDIGKFKGFSCFNLFNENKEVVSSDFINIKAVSDRYDTVDITWNEIPDAKGYTIYMDNKKIRGIRSGKCSCTVNGLKENTKYEFSLASYIEDREIRYNETALVVTPFDLSGPYITKSYFSSNNTINIQFSKAVDVGLHNFATESCNISDVRTDNKTVILVLDKDIPDDKGCMVYLKDIHDKTYRRNTLNESSVYVKPMLTGTYRYSYENGLTYIKDISFDINDTAYISFKIVPYVIDGTYQVFFSKAPKGNKKHFEFYMNPTGELRMFSSKGDHYLNVNLKEYLNVCSQIDVFVKDSVTNVYFNGKCVYTGKDTLNAEEGVSNVVIGALNDETLVFKGSIEAKLFTGEKKL